MKAAASGPFQVLHPLSKPRFLQNLTWLLTRWRWIQSITEILLTVMLSWIQWLKGSNSSSVGCNAFILFSSTESHSSISLFVYCASPAAPVMSHCQRLMPNQCLVLLNPPPPPPPPPAPLLPTPNSPFPPLVPSARLILDTSDYPTLSFTKDHSYKRQREEGICLWAKYLQADFHFQRLTPLNK